MSIRDTFLFSVPWLLTSWLPAQAGQLPVDPVSIFDDAVGLSTTDGKTWGIGPDYRVRFHEDGPEFSPVGAPSLRLRLAAVHRGGESLPVGRAALRRDGYTATYHRAAFDERYEIRPDGMEQSFLLRELPPGYGDLVIALNATTELTATRRDGDGLVLGDAGKGGIRIGGVTAIDAGGRRSAGQLRWRGTRLELVVAREVVQKADLPLLVDPLFGSAFDISFTSIANIKAAFEPASGVYLVVWTTPVDILAQRVTDRGARIGGVILVVDGVRQQRLNGVATVDSRNTFVVTWTRNSNVFVRAISTGGAMGAPVRITAANVSALAYGIAGSLGTDDSVYVLLSEHVNKVNTLSVSRVRVGSSLGLAFIRKVNIAVTNELEGAAISRTDGTANRYLVAWGQGGSLRGAVIDRLPRRLGASFDIQPKDSSRRSFPVVDGDGTSWLVAYHQHTRANVLDPSHVMCRRVVYDAHTGRAGPDGREETLQSSARVLDIARLRQSYLVCMHDGAAGVPFLYSVDPAHCGRCEGLFRLDGATGIKGFNPMAVATPQTGSSSLTTRRSLAVWRQASRRMRGRLFTERDGDYKSLGGGCGQGGEAVASCTRVGNTRFTVGLQGAASRAPAFLMFGVQRLDLRCGPCTLVPAPLFAPPITTTNLGTAAIGLGIPNDPRLARFTYMVQWGLFRSGGACNNLLELSNALQVVYER